MAFFTPIEVADTLCHEGIVFKMAALFSWQGHVLLVDVWQADVQQVFPCHSIFSYGEKGRTHTNHKKTWLGNPSKIMFEIEEMQSYS